MRAKRDVGDAKAWRKTKGAECSQCGANYQPPKPDKRTLSEFLPARTRSKRVSVRKSTLEPGVVVSTGSISNLSLEPPATQDTLPNRARPTLLIQLHPPQQLPTTSS
ncbi:MAG: hypothetical protein TREMPRED_004329, partial [Tremellales sp. Tagirdzhanova-0007]